MDTSPTAQDPREQFDIVCVDGTPTGETKERAAVHRDGDWHRAVHVWVYGQNESGAPCLLFQQRGLGKDTWPGRLDATVGGHLRAGEGIVEALREVEEEIGIVTSLEQLRRLGTRIAVNESKPGLRDRELQDVFLLRDDRPLTEFRPHPVELAALVRFPLSDLLPLLAGETATIAGEAFVPGAIHTTIATFVPSDFIVGVDRYFYRIVIAVGSVWRGERHVAV